MGRLLSLASLLLAGLLAGCTGWVPFFHADYGRGDGFTESQWQNNMADVGDLDRWSAGIGFAYGGFLPGLVEPRPPAIYMQPSAVVPAKPDPGPHGDPEPTTHDEVWHFLDWFGKLGPWALGAFCCLVIGLAWMFRDRIKGWIPKFGNNSNSKK